MLEDVSATGKNKVEEGTWGKVQFYIGNYFILFFLRCQEKPLGEYDISIKNLKVRINTENNDFKSFP